MVATEREISLAEYVAAYINEELCRGNDIDAETILRAIDSFNSQLESEA